MLIPFEVDPSIIHHIIYSQAGSIGKAAIELIMNATDSGSSVVRVEMTTSGFRCADDGRGFASREDVQRYFGRFGTPHQDGDAKMGRFRLGRGQVMAFARTEWQSNHWQMVVDAPQWGYAYDLTDLDPPVRGCTIIGTWYEPMCDSELMSTLQEIRDLVRYTPIVVELNGRVISRDPRSEQWDAEDDYAYYRVREEGAVAIYNLGVLVRHDAGHVWGAGGTIVTKQAIDLNISRTEILRKTCRVWRPVAQQFKRLADAVATRQGNHRKTEARRERAARMLLSGDPELVSVFMREEVITLLPGRRHVSMDDFLCHCHRSGQARATVIEHGDDVPKAETIARRGGIAVVHPMTLWRFNVQSQDEFVAELGRILAGVQQRVVETGQYVAYLSRLCLPDFAEFAVLRDTLDARTAVLNAATALDKETRRAWTALRWCLYHYCRDITRANVGGIRKASRVKLLIGESTQYRAWTDGDSYIAVDVSIVRQLKAEPMTTAATIFSLVEHELAHEGDSLDAGHDEAFYARHHDISVEMSAFRQRYLQHWLRKYTRSLEREAMPVRQSAYRELAQLDRANAGRQLRSLPPVVAERDLTLDADDPVPEASPAELERINVALIEAGHCPPPPDWEAVLVRAQAVRAELAHEAAQRMAATLAEQSELDRALCEARQHIADRLGIPSAAIDWTAFGYLDDPSLDDAQLRALWESKPWEEGPMDDPRDDDEACAHDYPDLGPDDDDAIELFDRLDLLHTLARRQVQPGETWETLERNATAAGFHDVERYLMWRADMGSVHCR